LPHEAGGHFPCFWEIGILCSPRNDHNEFVHNENQELWLEKNKEHK